MELIILDRLKWDLTVTTPLDFLDLIYGLLPVSEEQLRIIRKHATALVTLTCFGNWKSWIPQTLYCASPVTFFRVPFYQLSTFSDCSSSNMCCNTGNEYATVQWTKSHPGVTGIYTHRSCMEVQSPCQHSCQVFLMLDVSVCRRYCWHVKLK